MDDGPGGSIAQPAIISAAPAAMQAHLFQFFIIDNLPAGR